MYSWSSPPVWSMSTGQRGEELKTYTSTYNPGPGTYDETNQKFYKTAYPSWKVGKGNRGNLYNSNNPQIGPGSYDVDKKKVIKNPKPTLSKAVRGQTEFRGIPAVGPGSYESRSNLGTAPNFSFGYKSDGFQGGNKSEVPGPGAYDFKNAIEEQANLAKQNDGKSAFTRTATDKMTQSRNPEDPSAVPGPGAHFNPDVENYKFRYFTPSWSMGKASKDDQYDDTKNVPGPGKYHIPGQINTRTGFTILGKNKSRTTTSEGPAPNAYNQQIDPLRQTAPAFRIGKAERKGMSSGDESVPGPGAYRRTGGLDSKGAKIGTSVRPGFYAHATTPGPGSYDIRAEPGNTVKYSMGGRLNGKRLVDFQPGPGEYEPYGTLYMEKTNGAIIGESQRPALYRKGMAPGPGQYDVRKELGATASKFGTGRRVPIAKVNDEPGPGYYTIPSAIGNIQKYNNPTYVKEMRKSSMMGNESSVRGVFG